MNQAVLYSKYNSLQKNDATFVLNNYFDLVQWNKNGDDSIVDIGCGSGDVTNDLLLPKLPKRFGKLVGLDLSEEMVEFARDRCLHPKIRFDQMNIESEDINVDYEENFDHAFSFYCLHWVQNQKTALSNIHKMLKPGGDVLLTFLASNPIFEIYERLSKMGRWQSYMENFKKYVSPYQKSKDPVGELEDILKDVGFDIIICKAEERLYIYPNVAVLKKSITAVSPFYNKIPENLKEDYFTDYLSEVRRLKLLEVPDNNNEERIQVPYKLFIVYAKRKKDT